MEGDVFSYIDASPLLHLITDLRRQSTSFPYLFPKGYFTFPLRENEFCPTFPLGKRQCKS